MLKSKYLQGRGIFAVEVPNSASWIWKSIMEARKLVESGLRKRVGRGNKIQLWEDRWLSFNEDEKIQTVKPRDSRTHLVSDLIEVHRWKKSVIETVFCKEDAEQILQIPICLAGCEDNGYWRTRVVECIQSIRATNSVDI